VLAPITVTITRMDTFYRMSPLDRAPAGRDLTEPA
jgi:hypothetical protein